MLDKVSGVLRMWITYMVRQNCNQGPLPKARVTGNIWMMAGLRQLSAARTRAITQFAS